MRRLSELAAGVAGSRVVGSDQEVVAVEIDSRAVSAGELFACVPGAIVDGHMFAPAAVAQGASAVMVDRELALDVAQLVVPDVRRALGPVAAELAGHPSRHLSVVGVTGTNGKTTVVTLLRSILTSAGWPATTIGTLTGARTTPEAHALQRQLADALADGVRVVAMEVSSHGLVQHRVDATHFAVVAFTNLSQDHLDYHGSMEAYFEAKALLFDPGRAAAAVVNVDDVAGRELVERWNRVAPVPAIGYSLADVHDLVLEQDGSRFGWRGRPVRVPLLGRYNVANALAAAEVARALGIEDDVIVAGLAQAAGAPGRMESIDAGQPFVVLVDYAHTPDALAATLRSAREMVNGGRVIVVFGCGGDRDASKRAPMGAAASELADIAILTDDNPRSEDPAAIRAAVRSGMLGPASMWEEPDRRAAIGLALQAAKTGDVVVVAGKGHEIGQTVAGVTTPFDDRVVVREELVNR